MIPAMLAADGYVTQLEPHGPSAAMWPRMAA